MRIEADANKSIISATETYILKDHLRDQGLVVVIVRWSLYTGLVRLKIHVLPWGADNGPYNQVVFINRWPFR